MTIKIPDTPALICQNCGKKHVIIIEEEFIFCSCGALMRNIIVRGYETYWQQSCVHEDREVAKQRYIITHGMDDTRVDFLD